MFFKGDVLFPLDLGPNAGINLTGYHPPGLTPRPLIFSIKIPVPRTAFHCKTLAPRSKKTKQKSPPPGMTCLVRMPRYQ